MGFKVVRVTQSEQGTSKETVTAFPERWEAEEFAKARSEEPHPGGKVWYEIEDTSKQLPWGLVPLRPVPGPPETISELIAEAIGLSGGKADLKQIYEVVQKAKPNSSQHSIRGVLNHAVEDGKFIRNPDHTYMVNKSPKYRKLVAGLMQGLDRDGRGQLFASGAILDGTVFYPVDLPENELELLAIQNASQIFGKEALFIPKKTLVGANIKKVTDGLLLDLTDETHPAFWIVEFELGKHDPDHILSQVSGFLRSLKHEKTKRSLVKVVYNHVESRKSEGMRDWYVNSFVQGFTYAGVDAHGFIDKILHGKCGVIIVIDTLTPQVKEVVSDLSDRSPVKLIEFKTYWKQGRIIHTFSQPDLSQSD